MGCCQLIHYSLIMHGPFKGSALFSDAEAAANPSSAATVSRNGSNKEMCKYYTIIIISIILAETVIIALALVVI